jgi:hypothetical protein
MCGPVSIGVPDGTCVILSVLATYLVPDAVRYRTRTPPL